MVVREYKTELLGQHAYERFNAKRGTRNDPVNLSCYITGASFVNLRCK